MSNAVAFVPDVSKWAAWTPDQVSEILAEVDVPWYVAGGWAIDLFLGEQRRRHADLEIAVPRNRFGELIEPLAGYELYAVAHGEATALADEPSALVTTHQTWVRDPATDLWRLDVFREPSDGDTWNFRRDERIRLPYDRVIDRTAAGIPYGRPEVILLFKAPRADERKHHEDFEAVLPLLGADCRRWLLDALELVHPGHAWLDDLRVGPA